MGVAVMDIGSNSVRLLLWTDAERVQKLDTTRLGAGAAHGQLTRESMARTVEAVRRFAEEARAAGEEPRAFATSAVRDASNAGELLGGIREACGVQVDVLSGWEEALCAYLGALVGRGDGAVLDIGGNSTELALGAGGQLTESVSLQLGAVRLQSLFGNDRAQAEAYARKCVQASPFFGRGLKTLRGVGGTITSLAAWKQELRAYDPTRVDGCPLDLKFARAAVDRLWAMDEQERACLPGISPTRAQIIHQGALVLLCVMEGVGASQVLASVHDNLEGYARLRGLPLPGEMEK